MVSLKDRTPEASSGKTYPEPVPGKLRYVYRFLLGRPMDNAIRTNATFWHGATQGYPSRWLYLAGWKRAAIRLSATYALLLAAVVLLGGRLGLVSPTAVLVGHLTAFGVVALPIIGVKLLRDYGISYPVPVLVIVRRPGRLPRLRREGWVRFTVEGRKTWDRTKVRPLARALDTVLHTSHQAARARKWVTIPRDYRSAKGHPVVIRLPEGFTGADEAAKKKVVATVQARLGVRDMEATWRLSTDQPTVELAVAGNPPDKVRWKDVERYYLASEQFRPFLGITAKEEGLFAEMVKDSPHLALSAGPGAGKSELVKGLIMQALRWGWGVVILDWKEVSHEWAEGLPGVRIVRDIGDIHDWLVKMGEDLDTRKRAYREDPELSGRASVLIVYEEMNATSDLLMAYWQDLRATEPDPEVKKTMPLKSPALRAQNALVFGGRQLRMFCLFIAQRFSARVTQGNADIRECFQIKLAARFTAATMKMLCPEVKPMPKKPTNLGGWVAVMAGEAVTFQAALITTEEAREYAMGGQENPSHPLTSTHFPEMTHGHGRDSTLGEELPGQVAPGTTVDGPLEGEVLEAIDPKKLVDIAKELADLGVTLKVLRLAAGSDKNGDPGFPKPCGGSPNRGFQYDSRAVKLWARKRHARSIASKAAR